MRVVELSCSGQDIGNDANMIVCLNCGSVHGYGYVNEYIDFYENMHKIWWKSVYHRKYHIENVINTFNIQITRNQMIKFSKSLLR